MKIDTTFYRVTTLAGVLLSSAACGMKPKAAQVVQNAEVPQDLKVESIEAPDDMEFKDVKIFFWKEIEAHLTGEELAKAQDLAVSRAQEVMLIGREVDELDEKIFKLKGEKSRIERAFEEKQFDLLTETRERDEAQAKLATIRPQLDKELGKCQAKPTERERTTCMNTPRVKNLTRAVGESEDKVSGFEARIKNFGFEKIVTRYVEIDPELNAITSEVTRKVSRIPEIIDGVAETASTTMFFRKLSTGEFEGTVKNWNYNSSVVNPNGATFSTEMGNMTPVAYGSAGGTLTFDVTTQDRGVFQFKLARTRYQKEGEVVKNAADGQIRYSGDVVWIQPDGKIRRGIVKLKQKKNT